MEANCPEKDKTEVVAPCATKWIELYRSYRSCSKTLYFLLLCGVFAHSLPTEALAADEANNVLQRYRVLKISPIPNPKESPYPDCLTHILCQPIPQSGSSAGEKVDLIFYAFRKRVLYPAASLKPGDEVTLSAIPYSQTTDKIKKLRQVNDLPASNIQILFVSAWSKESEFASRLKTTKVNTPAPTSNRDLIIQTLIAHQGKVTGGMIENFFFWSHVPAMYEKDFWKVPPTRKNALGPLKSILLFKQHLDEKGIDLVFVPIPRSTTIYPGIATNIEYDPAIDGRINFAVRDLMDALEAGGVTCVDLTPTFLSNPYMDFESKPYPIYRRNDTHWSPSGVRIAATLIADTIKKRPSYNRLSSTNHSAVFTENATLEELPYSMPEFERPPSRRRPTERQPLYRIDAEQDTDRKLLNADSPDAEIHLLGDSFSNAYGYGAGGAGIQPHLVRKLSTTVNKIASASGGAAISPNQFARNIDHSNVKIVIWAVGESFLAAPDIWSDMPLDRPDALLLDKLLSAAHPSHNAFTFHLANQKTQGSYIAVGDPSAPESLPEESRLLWKNVHIANKEKSPTFSSSTWIQKAGKPDINPSSGQYPISWEVWINGEFYKSQNSPPDRDTFRRKRWNFKLDKFAGQTLDIELVCRRLYPAQALAGLPCWILPEINGATLGKPISGHPTAASHTDSEPDPLSKPQQSSVSPSTDPALIVLIAFIGLAAGAVVAFVLRQNKTRNK